MINNVLIAFAIAGIIGGNTQIKTVELKDPFPAEAVQEVEPEREYYTVQAKLTYYDACVKCCGKTDGITASGVKATAGRTIAAPPEYPFGQEIEIDGNIYVVEDRGGSIKGNRFDVYVDSHQEAVNLGVRYAEVKVYV